MQQTMLADIQRLRTKATPHINFFMQHVPDYFDDMGLLCICKLDLKNDFGNHIAFIFRLESVLNFIL